MQNLARFMVRQRVAILALLALVTAFFLYQCSLLTVKTDFNDLLPQKHPFIKVHNMIRGIFGGANQVIIMVQVRDGDIFTAQTLEKIKWRNADRVLGLGLR